MRFYIRDCNGQIVGNPKGYETHRGAQAQTANWCSSAARAIRTAVDAREAAYSWVNVEKAAQSNHYFSINKA